MSDNYRVQKETRAPTRLELKKYCSRERKHTPIKNRVRNKRGLRVASFGRSECPFLLESTAANWLCSFRIYERSSTGRAPVSKTGGWGFDSLRSCCLKAAWRGLPGREALIRTGRADLVTQKQERNRRARAANKISKR